MGDAFPAGWPVVGREGSDLPAGKVFTVEGPAEGRPGDVVLYDHGPCPSSALREASLDECLADPEFSARLMGQHWSKSAPPGLSFARLKGGSGEAQPAE